MSTLIAALSPEIFSYIIIGVLTLLTVFLTAMVLSNLKKRSELQVLQAHLASENAALQNELQALKQGIEQGKDELYALQHEHQSVREMLSGYKKDNERLTAEYSKQQYELSEKNNELIKIKENNAYLEAKLKHNEEQQSYIKASAQKREQELLELAQKREHEIKDYYQKQEENLKESAFKQEQALKSSYEERLKSEHENFLASQRELESRLTALGEKMLKERALDLKESSNAQFKITVDPLKEELKLFRELLDKTRQESFEQSGRLTQELKSMQEAQQSLSKQALDLTTALKSGGKSQGMWGELQLERVLDASGLTKGVEYEREVAGDRTQGEMGRPDVVIRLPENRSLIIDAKCSLTAYSEYCAAEDESTKSKALNAHVLSIKNHIDGLSKREYQNYKSLNSPAFVFMFVPLDGALQLAFNHDHSLYAYAENHHIYLMSPSTLIPSLKVVANLWMLARQNTHIRDLAIEAQKIADKFEHVRRSYDEILKKKSSFDKSLTDFGDRLLSGRSNLSKMIASFAVNAPKTLKELDGKTIDEQELDKTPLAISQDIPKVEAIASVKDVQKSVAANDSDLK